MRLPPVAIVMLVMTFLVLPVPLQLLLAEEMFHNAPHASPFFKELFILNNLLLFTHILFAMPAILFGPFLFSDRLRKNRPNIHKTLGKFYVAGCMLSAVTVLPLAISNGGGTVAHIGFSVMGCTWFTVTYFAYSAAVNKDFIAHRRWMMRSYALTFAFVHVNLTYKFLLPYEHMSIGAIKAMQSMVSWQFNLLLVELYLEATTFKGRWQGWGKFLARTIRPSPEDKFYGLKRKS